MDEFLNKWEKLKQSKQFALIEPTLLVYMKCNNFSKSQIMQIYERLCEFYEISKPNLENLTQNTINNKF